MRLCRSRSDFLIGLLLLSAGTVNAATCCGGASAMPGLITGDDQALMNLSTSTSSVVGDVPARGVPVFRADDDSESSQTIALSGSYRLTDRFQAGAEIPFVRRQRNTHSLDTSASGLGDIRSSAAYEVIPEWSYSSWRPHGFAFTQVTLPTGPSVYEATSQYLLDARGRGFFSTSLGLALLKSSGHWDFLLSGEGHRSFSKTIQNPDGTSTTLTPGYGASGILALGYSPTRTAFHIGLSLSPVYEGPISSRGEINSVSESQLVWSTSLSLGYAIGTEWSAAAVYTDQTLMGPAHNVSLSRIFAFNLQKRWQL